MKSIFKKLPVFILTAIIFFIGVSETFSQCMTYPVNITGKVQMSDAVIEGKVISKNSFWNSNNDFIYTSHVIDVYKVFKGNLTSNQVEIITEGGTIGNQSVKAEPSLELNLNETGIFLVKNTGLLNPNSPFSPALQFEGVASNQSFIKYDLKDKTAAAPHETYNDIVNDLYNVVTGLTGQSFTTIIPFNVNATVVGPSTPSILAFPTITGITTPSTAGTFTTVVINGTNFGAGPFGGTRALEFRDANNGGAGFIPTPANHIVSWTNTQIQARVPTQAGSGNIRVTNDLNESTISAVTITINFNETNVVSGGTYYQPDLTNDNGTGGYTFVYNNGFNGSAPAVAAFERALQTWRCGTFVNFGRLGTTATACQALDGTNLVTFDGSCALPAGVLGVSYSYYSSCGSGVWLLTENDLKFRTNGTGGINWNYGPAPTAGGLFDFESVALHELGHSHQLGHTILPVTVMNYAVGPNTDRRTLTAVSETAGGNDIMSRAIINNTCGPTAMVALNASNCSIAAPVANFSGTPLTGCNSLNVTFTDGSTGSPTSWNWSFPGGVPNAFVGQNPPVINYAAPGNYTVTLTVTNASGNDSETKTNYVVVNNCPPPVAQFTANPLSVCTNQTVNFQDLSTNSPTSWSWTFTGGAPASTGAQNPGVMWGTPGVYDVSLTATNAYGSDTETKIGYITVATCPVAPVANFSASPTTLCAGASVSFTDLSTNAPNSWQWTFPGGTPATSIAQNPTVIYNTSGVYNVTLTVTNGAGSHTVTFNNYITVNVCAAPGVAFTGWPTTICAGSTVSYQDQSTNSPSSWSWTFTGGTPAASAVQNPVITYNTPGVYNVTLQATNSFGNNSLTKNSYITVEACPAFGSGLIVNDGSLIFVEPSALVTVQGGFLNQDNGANIGRIDNWGLVTLSGDWTNNSSGNAFINSSPGTTELLGAAQFIRGSTTTNFYNLTLSGSGIKTLMLNTVVQGTLALNDRELATQGFWMHVTNTSVNAITRTGGFSSTPVQGFVSSTGVGRLRRNTNASAPYLFPVGSSQGTPRYRPVMLTPSSGAANTYAARFVNNDPTIDGFSVFLKDPNLGVINPYWYQKLNLLTGTSNPDITLYFDVTADNIPALPNLLMTQWAYNAPPVQWRAISGVLINGVASPNLSSVTKAAWISFDTENFNLAPQSIPLPVELVSFTGSCNNGDMILKWVTATEINNDYFLLERSYDGKDFELVSKISGGGTTNTIREYIFEDKYDSKIDKIFYRLRQFDFDGEESEARVININCSGKGVAGNIGVYPNPFADIINIVINQSAAAKTSIVVYDILGQVVKSEVHSTGAGIEEIRMDLSELAPAVYSVSVNSGGLNVSKKMVKQ